MNTKKIPGKRYVWLFYILPYSIGLTLALRLRVRDNRTEELLTAKTSPSADRSQQYPSAQHGVKGTAHDLHFNQHSHTDDPNPADGTLMGEISEGPFDIYASPGLRLPENTCQENAILFHQVQNDRHDVQITDMKKSESYTEQYPNMVSYSSFSCNSNNEETNSSSYQKSENEDDYRQRIVHDQDYYLTALSQFRMMTIRRMYDASGFKGVSISNGSVRNYSLLVN